MGEEYEELLKELEKLSPKLYVEVRALMFSKIGLENENRRLKQQLEIKDKEIAEAIDELYIWGEALMPKFQQRMLKILNAKEESLK